MTSTDPRISEDASLFRDASSAGAGTPAAVEFNEFWKRFALNAIGGGYFASADEFVLFVEACLRYLGFEQVVQDRPYSYCVRSLAEALARKWACGTAPENAPTADEIAGLLQSNWVTSGEFASLRSAAPRCNSAQHKVIHGL